MKPYYSDDLVTLYHGDCREITGWLEADVLVTDPPYGMDYKGYNHGTVLGDDNDDCALWLCQQATHTPTSAFGANHYAKHLPTIGSWSVWDKRTNENADRMFGSPFEVIWTSGPDRPGRIYRIQHGGVVNADGGNLPRVHPTQKPLTLMVRVINDTAQAGTIADPFAGSGSTLVAAKRLGRKAIGIELVEAHCETAALRLSQGVLDFGSAS